MTDTTAVTGTEISDAGNATPDSTASVDTTAQQPAAEQTQQAQAPKTEAPQVPESYEFQMPEGIELDKTAQDEFSAVAKELKLDQATAQKVADVGVKMAQRQQEVFESTKAMWAEQSRADKEIGGEKFEQNLAAAVKTLNAFGSQELKDVLNVSGLGNHPAVIKFLVNANKAISEDGFVSGAPKGANPADVASKLFPTMHS